MEDLYLTKIDFEIENADVKDCVNCLSSVFAVSKRNTVDFLSTIKKLYSLLKFTEQSANSIEYAPGKFIDLYVLLKDYFNLSSETVRHYYSIANYFMQEKETDAGVQLVFDPIQLGDYSISKLQDLCSLYVWQVHDLVHKDIISPTMTRDELRKIVAITKKFVRVDIRNYLDLDKKSKDKKSSVDDKSSTEESEQDIFDVSTVDITKYYDVEFFQKLDRTNLITLCLMYQEKYVNKENLKNKK